MQANYLIQCDHVEKKCLEGTEEEARTVTKEMPFEPSLEQLAGIHWRPKRKRSVLVEKRVCTGADL